MSDAEQFTSQSEPFLRFLHDWYKSLPSLMLSEVISEAGGPECVSIICIDLTNCFSKIGPLASPRIHALIQPVANLFQLGYFLGVRHFMLTQDAHPEDSPEFEAYGPHCIAGTKEADIVEELTSLPFSDLFMIIPKQTVNPATSLLFLRWLEEQVSTKTFIIVGDCTDICVYQTAMYVKTRADQFYTGQKVIVPANCVNTYDVPAGRTEEGSLPHDGELLHKIFLYHMALNNIRVVSELVG